MSSEESWLKLIPPGLKSNGRILLDMGVNNIAWKKSDALKIIKIVFENGFKILGGDVIDTSGEKPRYTYDNWYSDKETMNIHDWNEVVKKSYDLAFNYISKYREGRRTIRYVLVCANAEEMKKIKEKRKELERLRCIANSRVKKKRFLKLFESISGLLRIKK